MTADRLFETERLRLEPLRHSHMEDLVALDSDPAVMRYITGRARTREESLANFHKHYANPAHRAGLGAWAVRERGQPEFLGIAMLKPLDDRSEIEVGYRFHRSAWGRGFATEAGRRLVDYGFADLGLGEIVAVVHPDNAASQGVIEKLGLRRIGTTSAYNTDNLIYSQLLRADWQARRSSSAGAGASPT